MLWNIISSIVSFFSVLFRLLQGFIGWLMEQSWALFLAIVTPIISLVFTVFAQFTKWMQATAAIDVSEMSPITAFVECLNAIIRHSIEGDSTFTYVAADIVEIVNVGAFLTTAAFIVLPVMLTIFIYRIVKSWVPTVSGS